MVNLPVYIAVGTLIFALLSASTMIFGWAFKKILIGRYRVNVKPLWDHFVWRNELINSISENLVYPFFTSMVLGTFLAPVYFRMMGCRIGKKYSWKRPRSRSLIWSV